MSFSAPLLAVAGGGFVSLMCWTSRGFVSLLRWAGWGTGGAGFEGASGGFVGKDSSCAVPVSAGEISLVLAGGSGSRWAQPARKSKSVPMRKALETAALAEPESGGGLPARQQLRRPNWVLKGARSPR